MVSSRSVADAEGEAESAINGRLLRRVFPALVLLISLFIVLFAVAGALFVGYEHYAETFCSGGSPAGSGGSIRGPEWRSPTTMACWYEDVGWVERRDTVFLRYALKVGGSGLAVSVLLLMAGRRFVSR